MEIRDAATKTRESEKAAQSRPYKCLRELIYL
jgi:hypothetical protein